LKKIIQVIGFQPKENTKDIYIKKYNDGYAIEIDFGILMYISTKKVKYLRSINTKQINLDL